MKYFIILSLVTLSFSQRPWPHPPQNQIHPIGNSWGLYQDYGTGPYVHNGIDIMTQALWPTTAIKYGFVKAIWNSGTLYRGISVGDSASAALCMGYMYYHMDQIQVQVGDTVYVGDTIARVVTWTVANFHHNHFSKNRNSGIQWSSYGGFIKNPLTELTPDYDSTFPVFSNAVSGYRFAVCRNNTSTYLNPDSIYGTVDFICRVEDKINHRLWWCGPYKLVYSIRDTLFNYVVPPTISFQFSESLDFYSSPQVRTIYKDDATCNSNCNYDSLNRRLYFIFTNTDGDTIIEATDSLQGWNTLSVPDGYYWVKVIASDEYGNSRADSMRVRVKNNVGISEDLAKEKVSDCNFNLKILPNPVKDFVLIDLDDAPYQDAEILIYDLAGNLIRSLGNARNLKLSRQNLKWDCKNQRGKQVPPGIYFIVARGKKELITRKIVLLKG
ncbi:MAG: T9SS type A sorting domain-containing protein [candidate division WOR-3 bacterium]|nr:T9SS type A sorting domain-containing protein [candidate division WOR-3 bacterium]